MSLGALAQKAGLSKAILSRIEAGTGNPSLETLWHIAEALDLPLGSLLGVDEPPEIQVIRKSEGQPFASASGLRGRLLFAEGRGHRTEVIAMDVDPGVDYHSRPHAPGTAELVICLAGALSVGPQGREVDLESGDAVWFPADLPHRYHASEGARALVIMSYLPPIDRVR
ncbi:MAG: hypothetical protein JWO42_3066 [Chloroflexi bacterium]|nr:hypothetical protein [Chloroflexota bacterium]